MHWSSTVAEEEFMAGEMCASLKATMGMPATDGDKSAMAALFVRECVMEVSVTNIFYFLCKSRQWYFRPNNVNLLAK
jgi:hypothetical protein